MRAIKRFTGGCEPLAPIDVLDLCEWIRGLNRTWIKGADRPLVETDPLFLQHHTDRVVDELMGYFPECRDKYRSITAINPGDYVGWHTDQVLNDAGWITRLHVPIVTNPDAWFLTDGLAHHLNVGMAYQVNPNRPHAVANYGRAPRVHFMFDVIRKVAVAASVVWLFAGSAHAAYQFEDITCETTTTAGIGTIDLAGALTGGYLPFVTTVTSGNSVPYNIITGSGATRKVETGEGVFTDGAPDTLTRVAAWSSDGIGAELTLAGTSTVCVGWNTDTFTAGVATLFPLNLTFADATGIKSSEAGNPSLLLFTSVASAVNHITLSNAATGNGPILTATGSDAEVPLLLQTRTGSANTTQWTIEAAGDLVGADGNTILINSNQSSQFNGLTITNVDVAGAVGFKVVSGTDAELTINAEHGDGASYFNANAGALIFLTTTAEDIRFQTSNTLRWTINSTAGHLIPGTDATYDIGTSTVGINDLHLGAAGVINFDGGDLRLTHSSETLSVLGGNPALVLNHTARVAGAAVNPLFQQHHASGNATFGLYDWESGGNAGHIKLFKSRSGTIGSHTVVQNGDQIGVISFEGSDGDQFVQATTEIEARVDGVPANDSVPLEINFKTNNTEHLTIRAAGTIEFKNNLVGADGNAISLNYDADDTFTGLTITNADPGAGFGSAAEAKLIADDNTFTLRQTAFGAAEFTGSHGMNFNALTEALKFTTAAAANIEFRTTDTLRWTIDGTAGHLIPGADDTYDIGSAAVGVAGLFMDGDIEMRGGTDTTIAAPSAGNISVEGSMVERAGTQMIYVPAAAMISRATSGADCSVTYDSGTADNTIRVCGFDTAADEWAHFTISMPPRWNEGTITAQYVWTSSAGTPGQTVSVDMSCLAVSDDDSLNGALGTPVNVDDTMLSAVNDSHLSPVSGAVTCAGTPAANDTVIFGIMRDVSDDNLSDDMKLIGVRIFVTTDTANDG